MLPKLRGIYGQVAQTCEVSGDRLHVAGRFGYNAPGLPTPWRTEQKLAVTSAKIRGRQSTSRGVANVQWRGQRIPTGHTVLTSDFDPEGGFSYVTGQAGRSAMPPLKLFRVDAQGNRIRSFGNNGYISISSPELVPGKVELRVIALTGGRVLLLALTEHNEFLLRYSRSGKPDASWGTDGVVTLPAPTALPYLPVDLLDSASVTSGGAVLISASGTPTNPQPGKIGILKLSASGKVATGWADNGFWATPAPTTGNTETNVGRALMTLPRKSGNYAVLYADSQPSELGEDFDLKLAYVNAASGATTATNPSIATFYNGGDDGFPDATPWQFGISRAGPVFALARSFYERPGGSFLGRAMRFDTSTAATSYSQLINNKGFAVGAFAIDPGSRYLYFCGALGTTSAKAKVKRKREQRKNVAVRRMAL